jgi:hypothetical protein
MIRALLMGFVFINYCFLSQAEDRKNLPQENPVDSLAQRWVSARLGRCADRELAAALVVEKNSTELRTLASGTDCVTENPICLKTVDAALKNFFRMNYKRFSVRCSLSKVEINNNYLQTYGESVFGPGSSQVDPVEDEDFPKRRTADVEKPLRSIAGKETAN